MRKKIIIIFFICLLFFVLICVFFFYVIGGGKNNNLFPTPTLIPTPVTQQGSLTGARNSPQDQEKNRRSFLVGSLIDKLPYYGKNFSIIYDTSINVFFLYLNPSNIAGGNKDFDAFLKQNGIDERSWVENITIINKSITPAP